MHKKCLVFILVATLFCSQFITVGLAKEDSFTIGFSHYGLGVSWRVQMLEEVNYAVTQRQDLIDNFIVISADYDVARQISDIEDLITKKVDAILISAISTTALIPVVDKAMEEGIIVVSFDDIVETDNITANVIGDNFEFGRAQAEWLVNKLSGEGEIITFNGTAGTTCDVERREGAFSIFNQYPNLKIVHEVWADWDFAQAKRTMESLLASYPEIDGIWSQGGAMSEGILKTYLEQNIVPPPITGEDNNGFLKTWQEIRDSGKYPNFDSMATIYPTWMIVTALDVLLDALTGKEFEKITSIPVPTITSETLDQYVRQDLPNSFWCSTKLPEDVIKKLFPR